MIDEHVSLAEAIVEDADGDPAVEDVLEEIEKLREYCVPIGEAERSLRDKYDAYDYVDIEIPATGDAVGVRVGYRTVVIGRAVTPSEQPEGLFTITDARIGQQPGELSPPCKTYPGDPADPGVRKKDGRMMVTMVDLAKRRGGNGLYRLGGVTAIESGAIVDPHDLLEEDDATSSFEVNL